MRIVVDASVAVEVLLATPLGAAVAPTIKSARLFAPELLDAEVMAALLRQERAGRLSRTRAREAISDLRDWGVQRLRHRALLAHAWGLRGRVSVYDALYVAAARLRGATLVTADGPLSRAPGLGIVVQNVRP